MTQKCIVMLSDMFVYICMALRYSWKGMVPA